jgi:hypothetical protein
MKIRCSAFNVNSLQKSKEIPAHGNGTAHRRKTSCKDFDHFDCNDFDSKDSNGHLILFQQ